MGCDWGVTNAQNERLLQRFCRSSLDAIGLISGSTAPSFPVSPVLVEECAVFLSARNESKA